MYDVIIIGAGVSGCASARELSRYQGSFCVVEKEEDVCCGTSKANSAIVHAGYDAATGSLMAKLNVEGNQMMEQLSKDLDFHFRRNGSLVLCLHEEELPNLQALYERGIQNGVKELRILNREELKEMEPNITDNAVAALYAPTGGIVCPFGLTIALAENANMNGVEFKFNTEVQDIKKTEDGTFELQTNNGVLKSRFVVNAAGVYADKFHNMMSEEKIHITPSAAITVCWTAQRAIWWIRLYLPSPESSERESLSRRRFTATCFSAPLPSILTTRKGQTRPERDSTR